VTTVRYTADATAHPVGPPGPPRPLDGMAWPPVQAPPLVGAEGGLWLNEEGRGDE
jgi:hypothetical protein